MTARSVLAAALVVAAGCRAARPAPTPSQAEGEDAGGAQAAGAGAAQGALQPDGGVAQADAGPAPADLAARAAAAWASREDPAALDQSIKLWEEAALRADSAEANLGAARARRARAQRLLARASSSAAEATASAADLLAAAGSDAQACSAEARRSWLAAGSPDGGPPGRSGQKLAPETVEALYLEAVCSADWARTQGFTQLVERRGEIQDALRVAAELLPDLDGAGPDRELGRLLASLPAYAGGDLREARLHIETALGRAPLVPANHLLYARAIAVKLQDRALFEAQLGAVLEGKALTQEDRADAAEARELLLREDELFGPAQAAQKTPGVPSK